MIILYSIITGFLIAVVAIHSGSSIENCAQCTDSRINYFVLFKKIIEYLYLKYDDYEKATSLSLDFKYSQLPETELVLVVKMVS